MTEQQITDEAIKYRTIQWSPNKDDDIYLDCENCEEDFIAGAKWMQEQLRLSNVSQRSELLFAFIKDWKEEFKDENWDYLDFMAERFLGKQ